MALVAYDNSDSSEYEDDENESNTQTQIKNGNDSIIEDPVIPTVSQESDEIQSLFTQLPQPSCKKVFLEEDDEFLHKKELTADSKPKSRITIPSLNDFKDVDVTVPSAKTRATNGKKSGLLNILPQPRHAMSIKKSLIPIVIAQKPNTSTAKMKSTFVSPQKGETKGLITDYTDDSDNDDDIKNDFFSINKPDIDLPVDDLPLPVEQTTGTNINKQPRSIESYFKKDHVESQPEFEVSDSPEQYEDLQSIEASECASTEGVSSNNQAVLDDEAILQLCGSRGKRKREEIQIVDINQQEVLNEARQMLLKGLMEDTSMRQSSSKKRGNEPTYQQRRKHQITYLAHQAKANESELQKQWANNRMTRRQTQSKYGF